LFADRKDLYDAGVHGTKEAGIFGTKNDGGAFSIVINTGYEDDDDRGDIMCVPFTLQCGTLIMSARLDSTPGKVGRFSDSVSA
jgi:hypothetical protein